MDQAMNYQNMNANAFAYNTVNDSMASTSEHRSVLVSRKFINGLVTNYNKSKVNNDGFTAPAFEMPKFEVPKFDFNQEVVPNVEIPTAEESAPVEVAPVETPAPVMPEVNVEMPKFDFSSLVNSAEESTPVEAAPIETPVQPEVKVEIPSEDDTTSSSDEGEAYVRPITLADTDEEMLNKYANIDGISTETMLFEVQSTLNSLANMVSVLTQQRTDLLAQQEEINDANEALDKREEAISLKERTVEEKEAANELQRQEIEKLAADNAKQLSERTLALKAKAQELEDKERAYLNKVDELNKNIEKNVEDAKNLKKRAEELNAKEAELDKLSLELKGRLNNLVDAENKFKVIVKEFNDTVNFNNTLNSIASPIKQLKKEMNNEEKAA